MTAQKPFAADTADTADIEHVGGCLCGAIRYRIAGPITDIGHCHCRMCQRASGALAVTWLTVPLGKLAYQRGKPALYRSSSHGERRNCSRCGTPLTFRTVHEPNVIDITLASLDHPEALRPDHHLWTAFKPSWLTLDPDLPSYPGNAPVNTQRS